ncbi:MAG TPA: glycosyl hydrolase family 28-related protein [Opitutaceae bacterium]|jgi:hypothetical protein|nr:glycosyl hydrolase family 28-related protein [Opitutaceae bacterium]
MPSRRPLPAPRSGPHLRRALALLAAALSAAGAGGTPPGATLPWRTYEAEAMETDGAVLGPSIQPFQIATEASGLECVRLDEAGQHLAFTVAAPANALVVRYCLPDAPQGGGTASSLALYVNGRRQRAIPLNSRGAWLYGRYPFSNDPAEGKPRHFFDEARVPNLGLNAGDRVELRWERKDTAYCIVDLVDLEEVPPALSAPAGAWSIRDFGGRGDGVTDDTEALRRCVAAVAARGGIAWIPAGSYRLTGDIVLPSHVTVQGAGMWRTTFVGDPRLYGDPARRVRFKLKGTGIALSDFAIVGCLDYRNDQEPNDGIVGAGCADCLIRGIWIEHTKVGLWIYNGTRLRIEGCRIRDTIADGINLCVGTCGTIVDNCTTRGTGDDCFAIWPAAFDQGFVGPQPHPGHNLIRHCTGQLPFLANGGAIYGGDSNAIEDCAFTDITAGCGILVSTTFPTDDPARGIDNNFSGTTTISRCDLLRCGGCDHDWGWRGSLQICLDRRSLSGLHISGVKVIDSLSDGITVVAPGSRQGHGTLSDAEIDHCVVAWTPGADSRAHHGLWIRADASGGLRLIGDVIPDADNESAHFELTRAPASP